MRERRCFKSRQSRCALGVKSEEKTPKGGGIELILHRKITGSGARYYPREKTKTVLIDTVEQPCRAPDKKVQKITGDVIHPFVKGDDDYDRPWTAYSAPPPSNRQ